MSSSSPISSSLCYIFLYIPKLHLPRPFLLRLFKRTPIFPLLLRLLLKPILKQTHKTNPSTNRRHLRGDLPPRAPHRRRGDVLALPAEGVGVGLAPAGVLVLWVEIKIKAQAKKGEGEGRGDVDA